MIAYTGRLGIESAERRAEGGRVWGGVEGDGGDDGIGGDREAIQNSLIGTVEWGVMDKQPYLQHVITCSARHPINEIEALPRCDRVDSVVDTAIGAQR